MKKILIGLLVIVVIIVGALFAIPLLVPIDAVKNELVARVAAATGRDMRIDGSLSVSILPSAHLSAEGVSFGGVGGQEAFTADGVSFGVNLFPLLSGDVEVSSVTLERPHFYYSVDAEGRDNWTGEAAEASTFEPAEELSIESLIDEAPAPAANAGEAAADTFASMENLKVGRIAIVDGTVTYRDLASGTEEVLEGINLDIDMPDRIGVGTISGSLAWQGRSNDIALELGDRPVSQLADTIPVVLTVSNEGGALTLSGTALAGDSLFAGTVDLKGESLRQFATGFGADLPDAPGYGAFTFAGPLAMDGTRLVMENFAGQVGGAEIGGGVQVAYDSPTPGIGLRLAAGEIDGNIFLPQAGTGDAEAEPDGGDAPAEEAGSGDAAPAPATAASDRIDLSPLAAFNLNAVLSANRIAMGDTTLTNLAVDVQMVNSVLSVAVKSLEVNDAPGTATVTVDGSQPVPAISGAIEMAGLDLGAMMALAGTTAPVSGTAGVDLTYGTSGETTDALVANLQANGSVSLTNGSMTGLDLADSVGGDPAADRIDDMDMTATFAGLSEPVSVAGAMTWRGERFTVQAEANLSDLIDGQETPVSVSARSGRVNVGFAGIGSMDGVGTGKVTLSTPSLRNLLAWIGQPLDAGGGLKAFSLDGTIELSADRFTFDKTAFTLDASSGIGTGEIVFADKPAISAGLAMKVLDVTPYMEASGASGGGGSGGGGGGSGGGGSGGGGGGNAPIDFSGLGALDANLNLAADKILIDGITIGRSALTVKLIGGRLDANLTEMALYNGTGAGAVRIDGAAETPSVAAAFNLANVSGQAFLKDALGMKRLDGTGNFAFELAAAGKTENALMKSLSGKGSLSLLNGAILGIDIPNMLQSLSLSNLSGWQDGKGKTEFTEMSATYTITNGIATNNDLLLTGPRFALTGAGTVDLPNNTINYRVLPKLANKNGNLKDFPVPVIINGSLDKPKIYPEVAGVLQDPGAAIDQITGMGEGIVSEITGGGKDGKGTDPVDQIKDVGSEILGIDLGGSDDKKKGKDKDKDKDKGKNKDKKKNKDKDKDPVDQVLDLFQQGS